MRPSVVLEVGALEALFDELRRRGRVIIGPTRCDGAIILAELDSWRDLPVGWTDEQEAGRYRLRPRPDGAVFAFSSGPQSWKRFLFPPRQRLSAPERPPESGYAFIGVHGCDLAAIAVQDRVFLGGAHPDRAYAGRRLDAFIVAVQCVEPGATCFCASMGTGPGVGDGVDLVLTEVLEPSHHLLAQAGTEEGGEVLARLPGRPATPTEAGRGTDLVDAAAERMGRTLDTSDLPGLLASRPDHPRWDDVAGRCLACTNCTLVCPTCFCSTVEEVGGLGRGTSERWRRWDSCFTLDFSLLNGHSVRSSTRSRYRQWLTHKLDTWYGQFGTSGCVGCGRCITWCPVGIDLTEEVAALRTDPRTGSRPAPGAGPNVRPEPAGAT